MTVVAVVIPWRPGTAQRNAHHDYVRQHLRAVIPSALHIGVDSGVDSGHTPFSRAGSRNKGVRIAQASGADVVVICDADTLVEAEPLHAAIAAAGDGRLHLPYTWYRGLSEAGTSAYLDGTDPALCPTDWEHEWATGGVLVIQPEAWWAAGGMDERCRGWGHEDVILRLCADALLGPTVKHEGTITHLWHPLESGLGSPEHIANGALCQRYIDAANDPETIRQLIAERASEVALT